MNACDAVKSGDAALRQNSRLAQFRFPEEDRDFCAIVEVGGRCTFTSFPEREVIVIEDHRTASRSHLCEAIRQDRRDKTDIYGECRIYVFL